MNKMQKIDKKQQEVINPEAEHGPFLKWKHKFNEESGKNEFDTLELTDGSKIDEKNVKSAFKKAAGTTNIRIGGQILSKVAYGMSAETHETRLNEVSTLLPALRPQDETEALLLGQFLALHDSGMKCLRYANLPDQNFYHEERLFVLANKLLNTANQTMQTLLKYRSGGQQTVQVIHVHNEGQAIVAQNLSSQPQREGAKEKFEN